MKSEKKLEILLYRSPLKSTRENIEVDYKTITEIYEELELELPIENYCFLDGDILISDYEAIPESDKLYIKAIFTGEGGDMAEEGGKTMGVGAGLVVLGVIIAIATSWTGVGAMAGVSMIISGLGMIGSGYYLYTQDIDGQGAANTGVQQSPSIKGGRNSTRNGQKVPILLGRHRVFPWYASAPYTTNPGINKKPRGFSGSQVYTTTDKLGGSSTQYLHILFGNTYEHADVFDSTIQLGETPLETYLDKSTTPPETLSDIISFEEGITPPTYYPERIEEVSSGVEISRGNLADHPDPIEYTFTTAKKTKTAVFTFIFPVGVFYSQNGGYYPVTFALKAEWKHVGASDSTYQGFISDLGNTRPPESIVSFGPADVLVRETCRLYVPKTFDNDTASSPEYNVDRQYTFRFSKTVVDGDDPAYDGANHKVTRKVHLENYKSYTGDFDGTNPPETWPILPVDQGKISITSLAVKATDQLNGVIGDLNYEMAKDMPVWDGIASGPSNWSYGPTRNPASAFLYALTDPYVNKDPVQVIDLENRIDYASLETWYTFCANLDLECNNYIVNNMTVEELLKNVASTGVASWNVIDNKYTIYIDTYITSDRLPDDGTNALITQLFTPRNSWGFQGTKPFAQVPTCLKIVFINSYIDGTVSSDKLSEGGFAEEVRYVYADGRSGDTEPLPTDIIDDAQVFGAMTPDQVWRLGRYMLAGTILRPEVYTFKADIEHIMCTRWDRIKLQHDVPLFGLQSGRIYTATEGGGITLGFTSDEILQYEVGENYAVQVRESDGSVNSYPIDNLGTDSYSVTLTTPIVGTGIFGEDDLFAFGYADTETVDLVITKIEVMDEETATITCVEYNEAIYDAYQIGSGSIPSYTSRVSNGGTSGAITVNTLPESQEDSNTASNTAVSTSSAINYRTSVIAPTGLALNSGASFYPDSYTDDTDTTLVYVAYWNDNKIYTSLAEPGQALTKLNEVPSRFPKFYEEGVKILYIHGENNHLYLKDDIVTNELGSAIYTANDVVGFTFDPSSLNVFVWTYTNVYELDYNDSFALLNTYSLFAQDMLITNDSEVYYIKNDGFIYSNTLAFDSETLFYNGSTATQIKDYNSSIYFIRGDLGLIYSKPISDTVTTTSNASGIATSITWGFTISSIGEIVYSNIINGYLYLATATNAMPNPTLIGEPMSLPFTGDVTSGSAIITGIDNEFIDQLAVRDNISGTGIPTGAIITVLGNGQLTMSVAAVSTTVATDLRVSGDRVLLDANKVIINGTIEANKLSASAIDSKARASNGEKVTEIDLDSGTMVYRNSAGDAILTFDPNDVGNELVLDGTITVSELALISEDIEDGVVTTQKISTGEVTLESVNFVTGISGWKIDEDGSAEFQNVTVQGYAQELANTINITVGTGIEVVGSHYNTINSALTYLSGFIQVYTSGGYSATITLQATYTMAEQVIVDGLNFGWVEIVGSTSTTVTISAITTTVDGIEPIFCAINGATLPIIDANFTYSGSNSTCVFVYSTSGSNVILRSGVTITNGTGQGLRVDAGGEIVAQFFTFTGALYGILARGGGRVYSKNSTLSSNFYGVFCTDGSYVDMYAADVSGCSVGVHAEKTSTVFAELVDASGCTSGIQAWEATTISAAYANTTVYTNKGVESTYGSKIDVSGGSTRKAGVDTATDLVVTFGSTIIANVATGGTSQTINTITSNGIIFK